MVRLSWTCFWLPYLKRLQFHIFAICQICCLCTCQKLLAKKFYLTLNCSATKSALQNFGREKSGKFCPYLQRKFSSHSIKGGFLPQPPFSKNNCGGEGWTKNNEKEMLHHPERQCSCFGYYSTFKTVLIFTNIYCKSVHRCRFFHLFAVLFHSIHADVYRIIQRIFELLVVKL